MVETEEKGGKDPSHNPLLISIRITSASSFPESCITSLVSRVAFCTEIRIVWMKLQSSRVLGVLGKGGKKLCDRPLVGNNLGQLSKSHCFGPLFQVIVRK